MDIVLVMQCIKASLDQSSVSKRYFRYINFYQSSVLKRYFKYIKRRVDMIELKKFTLKSAGSIAASISQTGTGSQPSQYEQGRPANFIIFNNKIYIITVILLCLGLAFCGGRKKSDPPSDIDADGIADAADNCPNTVNLLNFFYFFYL